MGMSASQARLLNLTARKANTEFEAQQINQQRTTLSNKSANYYNDLLAMTVPTPPSVDNYTKTVYTFTDGALTNQVTSMIAQSNGKYMVSYLSQWNDDFAPVSAATSAVTRTGVPGNYTYKVGSTDLRELSTATSENITFHDNGAVPPAPTLVPGRDSNGDVFYYVRGDATKTPVTLLGDAELDSDDEYLNSLTPEQILQLIDEENYYTSLLNNKYGNNNWFVRYVENTSDGSWQPYFYKDTDLQNGVIGQNGTIISSVNCYTIGSTIQTNEIKGCKDCEVEKDTTGRYIALTIPDYDASGNPIAGTGITYALTTSTVTDNDAYNDALNQYEYEKNEYDQQIEKINAKIEIVQSQDKNLELRIQQLNTEHQAIQTEMDTISKLIKENVQKTFNLFQSA